MELSISSLILLLVVNIFNIMIMIQFHMVFLIFMPISAIILICISIGRKTL